VYEGPTDLPLNAVAAYARDMSRPRAPIVALLAFTLVTIPAVATPRPSTS
jgi:hypothetical protein